MARRSTARKPKAKLTTRTNTQKGNPRAGKKFTTTVNKKGQRVHRYKVKGKTVDVPVASKAQRSTKAKKQKRAPKGSAGGGRFAK